jgi:hypothetical protein
MPETATQQTTTSTDKGTQSPPAGGTDASKAAGGTQTSTQAAPEAKRFTAPTEPVTQTETKTETKPEAKAGEQAKPEEWKLEIPQGVTLPEPSVKEIEAFSRTTGLSKAQATALLTREHQREVAAAEANKAAMTKLGNDWYEQSMAHPELGGVNAAKTTEVINKALLALKPETRKAIATTEWINHPILREVLHLAGLNIPAGTTAPPPKGGEAPPPAKSPQERIYGRR